MSSCMSSVTIATVEDKMAFSGQCKDGRMATWGANSEAYVSNDHESGELSGIIYYTILNSRTIIINQIFVKRKFRGKGIAKELYKQLFSDHVDASIISTVPKLHTKFLVNECYFKIYGIIGDVEAMLVRK